MRSDLPPERERLNPPQMKAFYLLAAGLFLAAVSCERHEWEETKILHETHAEHADHGTDAGAHDGAAEHEGAAAPEGEGH